MTINKDIKMTSWYAEGYATEGRVSAINPYPVSSIQHAEWREGWRDAQREDLHEEDC